MKIYMLYLNDGSAIFVRADFATIAIMYAEEKLGYIVTDWKKCEQFPDGLVFEADLN